MNFKIFFLACCLVFQGCSGQNEKSGKEEAGVESSPEASNEPAEKTIVFFGNSITAGFNLEPEEAFPHLIQEKLDSLGYKYNVINAGLSGETTSGGLSRIDWVLDQYENIAVFLLELGGNDGLRGLDLEESELNLKKIIQKVRENDPSTKIILAGMQIPPNMGPDYANQFRDMFATIAESEDVRLIPFLLEGVGGEPELNLGDGIHPNPQGHRILAENVWEVLQDVLPSV